ncbi:acyltransferase family protein [Litoreibacter albidus]|uniref:acyltransferase family protein n=1 Tax=Litoreibacter albidus TaxID=670155 RepID=UPI003734F1D1
MNYRPEIDGLRAVAVVPVVLFHAGLPGFGAGFIGVDIFFVISGFLITTILVDDITHSRFSIARFYERRARRILPALFLVILLCIPFAWMWMLPDDLENMGQSIVATLLFSNNILLTLTTGYWDLAGEFKPLLHTWSLGVEEQYYLVFPILLLVIYWAARRFIVSTMAVLTLVSFALFLAPHYLELSPRHSAAVFYSLPTRAWQLLMGGLAGILVYRDAALVAQRYGSTWSTVGLGLVLLSLFLALPDSLHVTLRTLIGTIGATLLVTFAAPTNTAGRWLANRAFVLIGIISYSVYLFHQPLIAFTRIYVAQEPGILLAIPVALTFLCAVLSYRFVERPFRNRASLSTTLALSSLTAVSVGLLAFGMAAHFTAGFPQRVGGSGSNQANLGAISIAYNQRAFGFQTDTFPVGQGPNVLVLGNSFGRDMVNVLLEAMQETPVNIVYRSDHYDCFADDPNPMFQGLLSEVDIVLMASSILPQEHCVADDIARVTAAGGRILYVGTKHFGYNLNWIMRIPADRRANLSNALMDETLRHEREVAAMVPAEHYMSILGAIAVDGRVPITDAQGQILSPDRTHLTQAGARFVAGRLAKRLRFADLNSVSR